MGWQHIFSVGTIMNTGNYFGEIRTFASDNKKPKLKMLGRHIMFGGKK